ncbi:MAG: NACHT domain-containing protein [Drouetiella hepatica Uher 2000/2452]|uniref:NACHT domain-containing protein n=1 Tax=Drouetiella hepatica Uher 2000/2452 TaxID=904376 RepID=A0A951QHL8_9CYAN|nr:NACHT domain-containing protein [Drouetiella hepatica Uher 2000/2452]
MALPKTRRYRGFVLTAVGLQKLQQQIQHLETQIKVRQSPRSIAERVQLADPDGIHPITVRKILSGREGVDKRSIDRIFRVMQIPLEELDYAHAELCRSNSEKVSGRLETKRQNCPECEDSVEKTCFYGRTEELAALTQSDRQVRLLLGMGGMGKTAIADQFVRKTRAEFEFVVWRSLRHAPTLSAILRDMLQDLLGNVNKLPITVRELTGLLIETLQQYRCLLVLDHANAVLTSRLPPEGNQDQQESNEAYEEFLQIMAAVPHRSCLLLTSREHPKVLGVLTETQAQVLQLTGLSTTEIQQIFQEQGDFAGSLEAWRSLIDYYGGNPLMLRQVATRIQTYFDGNISDYLKDLGTHNLVFGGLRDLLSSQLSRLSALERSLISHLALQPDWISVQQLRQTAPSSIGQPYLLELLDSLIHRSLLDHQGACFKLQPVVAAYVNGLLEYQADYVSESQTPKAIEFKAKREVA